MNEKVFPELEPTINFVQANIDDLEKAIKDLGELFPLQTERLKTELEHYRAIQACIKPQRWTVICSPGWQIDGEQHYKNGTSVLTIKRT